MAASQKFQNYLWYLSPEVVALSNFYLSLPVNTKQRMVDAFIYKPIVKIANVKRVNIQVDKILESVEERIEYFVC